MRLPSSRTITLLLATTALLAAPGGAQEPERLPVIPRPQQVERLAGSFALTASTRVTAAEAGLLPTARLVAAQLGEITGATPEVREHAGDGEGAITLALDPALAAEAYRLEVGAEGVRVAGGSAAGVFHGAQTLRQLLPVRATPGETIRIPALRIVDAPRFRWRGMHLDVSRHFFSTDELRRFIDHLALYKFNRFHLHLTDDQGWRLEIRRYPELTAEGAWRTPNEQDREVLRRGETTPDFFHLPEEQFRGTGEERRYGGFYTQAEMREVIAYAAARHVTIVPEIDMPGHFMAAIASHPELSCTGQAAWGETFSVPLCPGKEEVYTFVENVLDEVAALFPGEYVHVGGDEVETTTWAEHPGSRALMRREGLDDVAGLQGYFIRRVERMLRARGKRMIGWDEIVEDGLSPTATVMYWRGWVPEAPRRAAWQGNDVIMSPTSCCYFDYDETAETLASLYRFEPVPEGLSPQEARRILGVQANLWSEYIPTQAQLEYMAFPRILALAELAWTDPARREWGDFERRLAAHYPRLDARRVHYRVPPVPGLHPRSVFTRDTMVTLTSPVPGVELRYTTDGTLPTRDAHPASRPIPVRGHVAVMVRPYYPSGLAGPVQTLRFERQEPRPADAPPGLRPGLRAAYHAVGVRSVRELPDSTPRLESAPDFTVPAGERAAAFGMIFDGYVRVPADGVYTFTVASDDGSALYVGDRLVVDNDGPHGRRAITGQVALRAGLHPVRLLFFEGGGGHSLSVEWEGPGLPRAPVPPAALSHVPPPAE